MVGATTSIRNYTIKSPLIYFFKEIDQGGFDCVVTYGSGSSNHCRIVSNMAASRKLPCYIVAPKESSLPTFNSKMMELFGSHFMITPVNEVHDTIERLLATFGREIAPLLGT